MAVPIPNTITRVLSMSKWPKQDWVDCKMSIAKECKRIRNILNKYGYVASYVHCTSSDVDQECENILNSSSRGYSSLGRRWIEWDDYGKICRYYKGVPIPQDKMTTIWGVEMGKKPGTRTAPPDL